MNLRTWDFGDWACFALGCVLALILAAMVGLL